MGYRRVNQNAAKRGKWKSKNINKQVATTLAAWDEKLLMCEKVDRHGNMMEVKWNNGKNAKQTLSKIQQFGEMAVIKKYS